MYSLSDYGSMIADRVRMDSYAYALKQAIRPDSVVLDIGAGTGIHALLAAKFGASRVYAVEPNEAIHLARDLAKANGFSDRIEFFQDLSTNITLPEQANIIVSDLRGALPPFGLHIPSIIDARQRHLAQDGFLIPRRDTVWMSLVEDREDYETLIKPWNDPYGLFMDEAKEIALHNWNEDPTDALSPRNLLTEGEIWAVLDYSTISDPDIGSSTRTVEATRGGTAHGLLLWFETELAEGIGFSNAPHSESVSEVYGRAFFPLLEPVQVSRGDRATISVQAKLVDGEYEWHWSTCIRAAHDSTAVRAEFAQSTGFAREKTDGRIAEAIAKHRPSLGAEGEVDLFVLSQMNGLRSMEEIAERILTRFPTRFKHRESALLHVYDLAQAHHAQLLR